ncbi:unnamed protein product [Hymenolepis diminuta]|uniref:ZU5 domain-containing protein n=1 Tax=Hymenolepis diminuta TaxID=6216 RepID=A0A0R3SM99_HYMDI|nr:unnamed protein product [Hymenolepis diminuta]
MQSSNERAKKSGVETNENSLALSVPKNVRIESTSINPLSPVNTSNDSQNGEHSPNQSKAPPVIYEVPNFDLINDGIPKVIVYADGKMTTIPLKLPLPGNIFTIPVTPLRKEKNVIVLGPLPESQTRMPFRKCIHLFSRAIFTNPSW